jgi:hypothetical protein
LAWLNAVPDTKKEGEPSRRVFFEGQNLPIEMPPVSAGHILDYLFELGLGIGDGALTHGEIESWQNNTGIELQSFEARTLKRLSETYIRESIAARAADAETPWTDAPNYMKPGYIKSIRAREAIRKAANI